MTIEAQCPSCEVSSRRKHSHYERCLSDTAVGGQELLIHLRVHRFLCPNDACARRTFVEQVPTLTARYGRRSIVAGQALRAISLAMGDRAGARLTARLAMAVSRMTLIRLIRALPDLAITTGPAVLGWTTSPWQDLRDDPDRHRHGTTNRRLGRQNCRYPGGLAAGTPRCRGRLPRPSRRLCRRRRPRSTSRDTGRRPLAAPGLPGAVPRMNAGDVTAVRPR
jgi:hypothetical protein